MTTTAPVRSDRPARPPAPALPPFEKLDRTHRAALEMLESFDRLLGHLEDNGADAVAAENARTIMGFFSGPGRQHHADEEKHVFPLLLAGPDRELAQHVHRLQQDHGWIEEDWRLLSPQIEAIAGGYNWYDIAMLRQALPVFTALYHEHIALEESLIYPAAKRQQQALTDGGQARTSAG